jgi:hypothetical protein
MPLRRYKQNFNISYKRSSAGDYAVLYNALSSLYKETSVDAEVDRLNVAVTQLFLLDTLESINILLGFLES